ncbi:MAG: Na+/H+ antiporter subunit E [Bacillota bacterium]
MYIVLLLFWIIYNGRCTLEVLILGSIVCFFLYWFMRKYMKYTLEDEVKTIRSLPRVVEFLCVVVVEVFKANFIVIGMILSPKKNLDPVMVTFETDLQSKLSQVILATCITLSPGTYTVKLEDGVYTVHALQPRFIQNIDSSIFVQKIKRFEE